MESPTIKKLIIMKKDFMKKYNLTHKQVNSIKWNEIKKTDNDNMLEDFNKLREKYVKMLVALAIKRTKCKTCYVSVTGSEEITSDLDMTISNIGMSTRVLEYFNDIFETSWENTSANVFDTNIYGIGFFTQVNKKLGSPYKYFTHQNKLYAYLAPSKIFNTNFKLDQQNQREWALIQLITKYDMLSLSNKNIIMKIFKINNYNKYYQLYKKRLEGTSPTNVKGMLNKYIEKIKDIEDYKNSGRIQATKMKDLISNAMFFGNETYFTHGAFFHVIGMIQMEISQKKLKITKEEFINSVIENFAYLFLEYEAANNPLHFTALSAKYINRIISALEKIQKKKEKKLTILKVNMPVIKKLRRQRIYSPKEESLFRSSFNLLNVRGNVTKIDVLKSLIILIKRIIPDFPINIR
jgi:hypothetical protein